MYAHCLALRQVSFSHGDKFGKSWQWLKHVNGSVLIGIEGAGGAESLGSCTNRTVVTKMRGSGSKCGETSVYGVVLVRNGYGNLYLSMELTTESEVAATTGSTATLIRIFEG